MNNIVLCGLPKSGKTTIGRKLASKCCYKFIDTDSLIETYFFENHGQRLCCREIYHYFGRETFRQIEAMQIAGLNKIYGHVISIGGGTLENIDSAKFLRSIANIIYLQVCPNIAWQRIQESGLAAYLDPTGPKESFLAIAAKRSFAYQKFCHGKIETNNLDEEEITQKILNLKVMRENYGK